jgi:nucleoid-associated protein YgaU
MLYLSRALIGFALLLVAGVAGLIGLQHFQLGPFSPPVTPPAPRVAAVPPPAPAGALATAREQADALATALTGIAPAPAADDGIPSFDVARVEPSGEAVIAGRAAPGSTVELLRNGEVIDRAVADRGGQFAMVPPKLPAGSHELTLRARQGERSLTSRQSVAVAIEGRTAEQPVVALMAKDKPTLVLSQPQQPARPGTVTVEAVETEGGKLHVSGRAGAGATVRLYLNDSFLAAGTADGNGRVAFTINEGVGAGSYRVRLDEIGGTGGQVTARAEVPFSMPDQVAVTSSVGAPRAATTTPATQLAAADGSVPAAAANTVVVPKITTTTVSRGDSLWRISRTTYGEGTRYAVIYKANRDQIRNPDRIYPGQIFVLPAASH